MSENPYKYTEPLDPGKDRLVCIPRDEEVKKVVEDLKNGDYWVVVGPSQIGKTTFLHQVEYMNLNAYHLHLNFENWTDDDPKHLYQWIIDQLIEQIPHDSSHKSKVENHSQNRDDYVPGIDFLNFLKAFQPKEKAKQVVLLLDEVENIPFLDKFLSHLKLINPQESKKIKFQKYSIIMTGSVKLVEKTEDFISPLEKIAKTLYLKDFSDKQSGQLIDEPFRRLSISIDEKAKEKLINSLNGHPQMLQQSCHFLVQRAHGKGRELEECDIDDALTHVLKENPVFNTLEQDIRTGKTLQTFFKRILAGEQIKDFPLREFSDAEVGSIVKEPDSCCAIRNKVFRQFLKSLLAALEKEELKISPGKLLIEKPSKDDYLDSENKKSMPCAIKQIRVKNYHGIIETGIHLPVDARWIFLTGENAYGKTAFLRSLTIGLFGSWDQDRILLRRDSKSKIAVEIYHNKKHLINNVESLNFKPFGYFSAYGPSRLEIQSDQTAGDITGKSTKTYSMFNSDGVSLNIGQKLLLWYLANDSRYKVVKNILLKLMPHGADITVDKKEMQALYIEKESDEDGGSTFEPIPFQKLAAGNKSIIAMIGDLLIRFYQEYENDGKTGIHPVDFEGIVIIDEFDLHWHPKWLRELPGLLSGVFPKIQFITSINSEIPILGAPKDSILLKVTRTREQGIKIERVHVDYKNLLPHHLLTSPIFYLEKIIPKANEHLSDLRTADNYSKSLEIDEIMGDLR